MPKPRSSINLQAYNRRKDEGFFPKTIWVHTRTLKKIAKVGKAAGRSTKAQLEFAVEDWVRNA